MASVPATAGLGTDPDIVDQGIGTTTALALSPEWAVACHAAANPALPLETMRLRIMISTEGPDQGPWT
jgi:hypothetical protein